MSVTFVIADTVQYGKIKAGPYLLDREWVVDLAMDDWEETDTFRGTPIEGLSVTATNQPLLSYLLRREFPHLPVSILRESDRTAVR